MPFRHGTAGDRGRAAMGNDAASRLESRSDRRQPGEVSPAGERLTAPRGDAHLATTGGPLISGVGPSFSARDVYDVRHRGPLAARTTSSRFTYPNPEVTRVPMSTTCSGATRALFWAFVAFLIIILVFFGHYGYFHIKTSGFEIRTSGLELRTSGFEFNAVRSSSADA